MVFKLRFLSFMTKVNLNNGNKTKSDIFPWDIFKSDIFFIRRKILKYFNDFFITGTFQIHCKSEHKQVK